MTHYLHLHTDHLRDAGGPLGILGLLGYLDPVDRSGHGSGGGMDVVDKREQQRR